jgi:glycosyltransferase involved in cell wall biosynthesis
MKVVFYIRANHEKVKGGDLIQLYKTAEYLKKKSIKVDISSNPNKNLKDYDLVHIFNSPRFDETIKFFNNAKKYSKPVAFSTIYWPKDELAIGVATNASVKIIRGTLGVEAAKKYRSLAIKIKSIVKKDNSLKIEKRILKESNILLPNSKIEMNQITANFGVHNKFQVVRNAVDSSLFTEIPRNKRQDYILSVGRIERRKNTLLLIEACREIGKKLVLIGGYDKTDIYAKDCLKLIKDYGFKHIDNIDQKDLLKYYYSAKVHAIAAWYETPGLASMEAACGGCNVVSTDRGSTRDYFGKHAFYCNPFSLDSIIEALQKAINSENSYDLRKKIIADYTWEGAAEDTIKGYNSIV